MIDEPHYMKVDREAAEKLDAILALPMGDPKGPGNYGEEFDPWLMFPALYGSYSSEFDDLAIQVLSDIENGNPKDRRADLAAEMFREMLCTADLCEYGTSPRVCFPTTQFGKRIRALIEKWEEYRRLKWGDEN